MRGVYMTMTTHALDGHDLRGVVYYHAALPSAVGQGVQYTPIKTPGTY